MTTDIQCKLLSLYKFKVYYNEDDAEHSYEYMIIADTLSTLIDAITDREIEYSMHGSRKYLTVSEFLLMPCEQAHKGYHLFDVDDHDIMVSYGLDIENQHYMCRFKGDEPKPVMGFEKILEYFDEKSDQLKNSTISRYYDEILANSIYHSSEVKGIVMTKKHIQKCQEDVESAIGDTGFEMLKDNEGGNNVN